ncbi:MAG: TetR/AcrR family transcriptional regulator [Bacilli bacterium]|jgi:AcrR family transcriptional regulator|nr:TetR/AcrR family transcriptional regulator [Bacilli bacterium]
MLKRACTDEQIAERRAEIVQTVSKMYDEMDYQSISMKTISERISIARSSLYCYYGNKEEIMLEVLKGEYASWAKEMKAFLSIKRAGEDFLAEGLAAIYLRHMRLLEMVSIHLTDIEVHCPKNALVAFKRNFVGLIPDLSAGFSIQFPQASPKDIEGLCDSLLMLTYSLYPMIHPSGNQYQAMKEVGMKTHDDAHAYCKSHIAFLLKAARR